MFNSSRCNVYLQNIYLLSPALCWRKQARNTFCVEFKWRPLENKYFGRLLQPHLLTRKIKNFCNSPVCNTTALQVSWAAPWNKKVVHSFTPKIKRNFCSSSSKSNSWRSKISAYKGWVQSLQSQDPLKALNEAGAEWVPESVCDFTWGQFAAQRNWWDGHHRGSTCCKWV